MISRLYENDKYLNKDIEYIFGNEIIEYDLKSAGFNILCHFNLISDSTKNKLANMGKKERQVQIGIMQKNNKEFAQKLSNGFKEARRLFFEANNIGDLDILSVKKDAIFTLKPCRNVRFGNLFFDTKNKYTSYLYLNRFEFLYNQDKIDIKGIDDNNVVLHNDGFLLFLKDYFMYKENMTNDYVRKFIIDFAKDYKEKELPIEFYRELNKNSLYKTNMVFNKHDIYLTGTNNIDILDISYNYLNYIIPLTRILI